LPVCGGGVWCGCVDLVAGRVRRLSVAAARMMMGRHLYTGEVVVRLDGILVHSGTGRRWCCPLATSGVGRDMAGTSTGRLEP